MRIGTTTDVSQGTAFYTIPDINSKRIAIGSEGVDSVVVGMFWNAVSEESGWGLSWFTMRVYEYERASITNIYSGTNYKGLVSSATNTVVDLPISAVQNDPFAFGYLSGDYPNIDVSGSYPYFLVVLGETKIIRVVSIVGDYVYNWL